MESETKSTLISVLILILAAGVVLIEVLPARKIPPAAPAILDSQAAAYAGDVYPAFAWHDAVATTTTITENGSSTALTGTAIVSLDIGHVNDVADAAAPFTEFYNDKLTSTGWTEDKNLDADGPASSSRTYRKGNQVTIVSYTSVMTAQAGSPSTCPCDMTFTVFTGE